ncbi:MAG: hypothetical protein UX10_C0015G0012 [Candidatus Magasanikbacteria bacterium GW2011_GWA2_45_39]|uniref:HD domain-containing protein n=2 Tax=Candidatus Magasanikiibacteriota TaxID=1752731 RepID=A0A0G1MFP2_9BACT|nr:MAG: hypothetical protein UX10_C0015G0012 [Candidatus Magasanikbacteria bacterium GW2011_GWA2_45_39]
MVCLPYLFFKYIMKGYASAHFEQFGPEENQTLLVKLLGEIRNNKPLITQMQATPRFERYFKEGRENERKNKDAEELGHSINMYHIAVEMAQLDPQLDSVAVSKMKLAALIHDIGELEDGDVSYDEKQESDEAKEVESFLKNVNSFFPGLSAHEIELIKSVYFEIAFAKDKTKGEARYFNMIETAGYLNAALQEFESKSDSIDWQWLCANILHNQGKKIVCLIEEMPVTGAYLRQKKEVLKSMIDWAEEHIGSVRDFSAEDLVVWREILAKI